MTNQHQKLLATRDPRVEQIAGEHGEVLRDDWDHHGRIVRALALVDGRRERRRAKANAPDVASEPVGVLPPATRIRSKETCLVQQCADYLDLPITLRLISARQ